MRTQRRATMMRKAASNLTRRNQNRNKKGVTDEEEPDKRKPTPEEATLTARNYRLAKELSETRIKLRDANQNVNNLTMENMNLASRCRDAIAQAKALKKQLSEALQKGPYINKSTALQEMVAAEVEKMDQQLLPPATPIRTTAPAAVDSSDFEDEEEELLANKSNPQDLLDTVAEVPSSEDNRVDEEDFSPRAASPKFQNMYNEEFPGDIKARRKPAARQKMQMMDEFAENEEGDPRGRKTLMSSIDAFEASFNTSFPESFSPKEEEEDEKKSTTEIYNPFIPSPKMSPMPDKGSQANNNKSEEMSITGTSSRLQEKSLTNDNGRGLRDRATAAVKAKRTGDPPGFDRTSPRKGNAETISSPNNMQSRSIHSDRTSPTQERTQTPPLMSPQTPPDRSQKNDVARSAVYDKMLHKEELNIVEERLGSVRDRLKTFRDVGIPISPERDANLRHVWSSKRSPERGPSPVVDDDMGDIPMVSSLDSKRNGEDHDIVDRPDERARRNLKTPISYSETSISSKLRRGDVFFATEGTTSSRE